MEDNGKEHKVLFPEESYKLENGDTVMVSPVPFGQMKHFAEGVAKLLQRCQGLEFDMDNPDTWTQLLTAAFEEVTGLMGLVLKKDMKWFDLITFADGIGLLHLMVKQNVTERTKKNIQALVGEVTTLRQTLSNS